MAGGARGRPSPRGGTGKKTGAPSAAGRPAKETIRPGAHAVFFNGSQRRSGNRRAGDRVRLGSVEFELEEIEGAEPPPPTEDRTYIRVPIPAAPKAVNAEAIKALLDTSRELMAFTDLQGLLDRVLRSEERRVG